jgi:hypothetical protein
MITEANLESKGFRRDERRDYGRKKPRKAYRKDLADSFQLAFIKNEGVMSWNICKKTSVRRGNFYADNINELTQTLSQWT